MRLPRLSNTRPRARPGSGRRQMIAAELAYVARLQRDLGEARRRYGRAIAELESPSAGEGMDGPPDTPDPIERPQLRSD
jgi:hypothetical protein